MINIDVDVFAALDTILYFFFRNKCLNEYKCLNMNFVVLCLYDFFDCLLLICERIYLISLFWFFDLFITAVIIAFSH